MSDSGDWTELAMGARMSVDQEFRDRVEQSEFTHQQWGLVMTAVEFEIENPDPDDPGAARLVGDTDSLPAVLPELDRMAEANPMAGAAPERGGDDGGGLLDSVKGALGLDGDGGSNDETAAAAELLVEEYAERLQAELERTGQWEHVVAVAATDREGAVADGTEGSGPGADAGTDGDS